jgi:WhiB family redox-sensing transcriptional regulator
VADVPLDSQWHWQDDAACYATGNEVFFNPLAARGHSRRRRETMAQSICAACPVRRQCADYAIRAREPYGVWGGLTESQRQVIYAVLDQAEARNPGEGIRAVERHLTGVVNDTTADATRARSHQ